MRECGLSSDPQHTLGFFSPLRKLPTSTSRTDSSLLFAFQFHSLLRGNRDREHASPRVSGQGLRRLLRGQAGRGRGAASKSEERAEIEVSGKVAKGAIWREAKQVYISLLSGRSLGGEKAKFEARNSKFGPAGAGLKASKNGNQITKTAATENSETRVRLRRTKFEIWQDQERLQDPPAAGRCRR